MGTKEITKERHEMLVNAHKKGANLSMRDFAAIDAYEKKMRPPLTLYNTSRQGQMRQRKKS